MSARLAVAADLAVAFSLGGCAGLAGAGSDWYALPLCGIAAAVWILGTRERIAARASDENEVRR